MIGVLLYGGMAVNATAMVILLGVGNIKVGSAAMVAGFAVLAVAEAARGQWLMCGWSAAVTALWVWIWWHSGGGDDWRRRRRKVGDWARSHIPRPTVIHIRPIPVRAS